MTSSPADVGRLLDTKAAIAYLGLREDQIRELVFRRQIPYTKVGRRLRFDREALEAWIKASTVEPQP